MDIGRMAINMSQNSLKSAVSISLMKLQVNSNSEMAVSMKEIMDTMAVDTSKGNTIDVRA